MSDASKRKEKQKLTIEKPKLDHARSLRGIYFIAPKDEEFKDIMKNARRKLENPVPAAMLCKTPIKSSGENLPRYWEKARQNMLVLSKLTSPRELDWKEFLLGIIKITLQQKE